MPDSIPAIVDKDLFEEVQQKIKKNSRPTNGVTTDLYGKFSLNVKRGATLVISYIGYKTQEEMCIRDSTFSLSLKLPVSKSFTGAST